MLMQAIVLFSPGEDSEPTCPACSHHSAIAAGGMEPAWVCSAVSWYFLRSVCPHPLNSLPSALLVSLGLGGNELVVCLLSAGLNLFLPMGVSDPLPPALPRSPRGGAVASGGPAAGALCCGLADLH